jgi:glutamine amidotransferase
VIAVLDYGIGNLRSAEKALVHLGADARLVRDPAGASGADGVVLPGVGAFGACAEALRASGLDRVVLDAAGEGLPVLGLCVGFQLLFERSEESTGERGLGLLGGTLRLLPAGVKRPQMQWNLTPAVAGRRSRLFEPFAGVAPWFYYVHSYAALAEDDPDGACVATCEYGAPIVAAVERGSLFGTQFHPEKSGAAGLALLGAFVACCAQRARPGEPAAPPASRAG